MEPMTLLIIAVIVGAFILAWRTISNWVNQPRHVTEAGSYAEIVRTSLKNGEYTIVAGVFNREGNRIARTSWNAIRLDRETRRRFGSQDRVRISLE